MKEHPLFEDYLRGRLRDPAAARGHVEAALELFESDGDAGALVAALKRVAEAQGPLLPDGETAQQPDSPGTLLRSLGYRLTVEPLGESA